MRELTIVSFQLVDKYCAINILTKVENIVYN